MEWTPMPREWSEGSEDAIERVANEVYEYLHEIREQAKAAAEPPALTPPLTTEAISEHDRVERRDALIELTVALLGNDKIVKDNDAEEIAAGALSLLTAIEKRADPTYCEPAPLPFTPAISVEHARQIEQAMTFAARCEGMTNADVCGLSDTDLTEAITLTARHLRGLLAIIGTLT